MEGEAMSETRLIRVPAVLERIGFKRAKLYTMIAHGQFPRPIKIGGVAAWKLADVERWIEAQETAA